MTKRMGTRNLADTWKWSWTAILGIESGRHSLCFFISESWKVAHIVLFKCVSHFRTFISQKEKCVGHFPALSLAELLPHLGVGQVKCPQKNGTAEAKKNIKKYFVTNRFNCLSLNITTDLLQIWTKRKINTLACFLQMNFPLESFSFFSCVPLNLDIVFCLLCWFEIYNYLLVRSYLYFISIITDIKRHFFIKCTRGCDHFFHDFFLVLSSTILLMPFLIDNWKTNAYLFGERKGISSSAMTHCSLFFAYKYIIKWNIPPIRVNIIITLSLQQGTFSRLIYLTISSLKKQSIVWSHYFVKKAKLRIKSVKYQLLFRRSRE